MTKKSKEVKSEDKLSLENIKVGDKILDLHNEEIEITDDLIEQMKRFEKDTKKSVIWRGKITGSFLYFKWMEEQPEEKISNKLLKNNLKLKIEESLDEAIEEEVETEENLLLDAIEDYRMEFNVKKVNVNTKKFKEFFEEWKQAE